MKVTLRETYSWKNVVLLPEEQTYSKEFVTELEYKDVMEILDIQVKMESLQQRLRPIYEAMVEVKKLKDEAEKVKAEMEALEKEGETLPTEV